ncbi:transcriptional Coactivator p15-domain-containing protein [Xylaria sp. CBS 124048]|nr:transcriptional Coactivator p15-domain-containing protein [Xylaria sp. CBS 124048]
MGRSSTKRRHREEPESSSGEEVVQPSKKAKTKAAATATASEKPAATDADQGKDEEGNTFWTLAPTRRVTIQPFRGKTFVNIREYYADASGALKPTKKGIMLPVEQYQTLVTMLPAINATLQSQGHDVPTMPPALPSASTSEPAAKASSSKSKKTKKMNIEATSDEEDSESD